MKCKNRGGAWSDKVIYEWQEEIYEQLEWAKHFIKQSKLY
jgi:hypothetical protein